MIAFFELAPCSGIAATAVPAMLVGRGSVLCIRCGCDRPEMLEINHKNGGGREELRRLKTTFYRMIARLERAVDDLELLCRPCNAVHALELRHGPLPFKVTWLANSIEAAVGIG